MTPESKWFVAFLILMDFYLEYNVLAPGGATDE